MTHQGHTERDDCLRSLTTRYGAYDPVAAQEWKAMRQRERARCDALLKIEKEHGYRGELVDRARELYHKRGMQGDFQDIIYELMGVQADVARIHERYGPPVENWASTESPSQLTGYDFVAAVRAWLRSQKKDHLSVCEVLLEEGCAGIGPANVFYSHMQQPCITQCIRRMHAANLTFRELHGKESSTFYWLDYFTLRQCRPDFDLDQIQLAIKASGCTLAEIDSELDYIGRSFCVFEIYSTVSAQKALLVNVVPPANDDDKSVDEVLDERAVDCLQAQTRDPEDKQKIDRFISEVGAETVNAAVTLSIREGRKRFKLSRG